MADHVGAFLEMLAVEHAASPHTLAAYRGDLQRFAALAASRGVAAETAGEFELRAFLAAMAAAGEARTTQNRRLSAVRSFLRFLYREGVRADDPGVRVDGPKKARALPRILSIEEVGRLLRVAHERAETDRLEAVRMAALVELLYAAGLRVSELVALPEAAVAAGRGAMVVRGKGGRERLAPVNGAARVAVARWREARGLSRRWLFPSIGAAGHLTRQAFARDLKVLAAAAGIPAAKVSPHVMRHAFATHLVTNGADLRVVQTLLGHQDLATTEIYTHVAAGQLASVLADCHPLAEPVRTEGA